MKVLISQGAEAKLYKDKDVVIKERIPKLYRIKELDEKIRKQRNRTEVKLLKLSNTIISSPKIISNDTFSISMEFIDGLKVADCLDDLKDSERKHVCTEIGKNLALLHNSNIIHGDLTTSNMILKDNKVYFIDFGLGFINDKAEHKAVDLHLLKQALESKHYKHFESCFKDVIDSYSENINDKTSILDRLDKVEKRGRYKNKKSK
ncbi:MAG: KEOPS complex kinase/ATPase Bud32 [Nanoarchaeota archaeon]